MRSVFPVKANGTTLTGRAIRERMPVQIADVLAEPSYGPKDAARLAGFRANLAVPMMREGHVVGAISVCRAEAGPFPDKQVQLLQTFADQAVIAIENVRLFKETQDALAQPDGHRGHPAGDQQLADERPAGVRRHRRARRCGCSRATSRWSCCGRAIRSRWSPARRGTGPPSGSGPATPRSTPPPTSRRACSRPAGCCTCPIGRPSSCPTMERRIHASSGMTASLMVPLVREGECIGVLVFGRKTAGAVPRRGDRAGRVLRRPGADRHRERAAVQRDEGGAGAADRDRRGAGGHQPARWPTLRRCSTTIVECCDRLFPAQAFALRHRRRARPRGGAGDPRDGRGARRLGEASAAEVESRIRAAFPRPLAGTLTEQAIRSGRGRDPRSARRRASRRSRPCRPRCRRTSARRSSSRR